MDIRNFFGYDCGTTRKSALSEVRESRGSPPMLTKKPYGNSPRKKPSAEIHSSSDDENPLPKSLRTEKKKHVKKRRISISSDDEMPASASQTRPSKRSGKITALSTERGKSLKGVATESLKQVRKRPPKSVEESPAVLSIDSSEDAEALSDDDYTDFVPAKKSGRRRTPPGQTKLQFEKRKSFLETQSNSGITQTNLKRVDPADFFKSYNSGKSKDKEASVKSKDCQKKVFSSTIDEEFHIDESEDSETTMKKQKVSSQKSPKSGSETKKNAKSPGTSSSVSLHKGATLRKSPEASPSPSSRKGATPKKRLKASSPSPRTAVSPKMSPQASSSTSSYNAKKSPAPKSTSLKSKGSVKPSLDGKAPSSKKKTETFVSASSYAPTSPSSDSLPWVDKYKPTSLKHLVGQHGEKSPMNKLMGWLRDWSKYHLGEGAKQKRPRPPPWLAQNDGTSFKAVLLSGPPGIGKTTCALLACQELGLEYVEMNASDARNKKLLDVRIAELLGSRQIIQFFGKSANIKSANSTKLTHVLIMDEVDGMSGNEDRAGLAELIQMIKETKIPIICICNDRQSPKMRTLVNYCFDLRFPRPRVEQIRPRIQTIAFQEKLKLTKEEVDEVIEASNHDVRQTIYNLQLLSRGTGKDIHKKDVAMNLFEAARVLLNAGTEIPEKQRMYFVDYSMMPLFVQENYPNLVSSKMNEKERLKALQRSADSISTADLIDKTIRSGGSWTLLNEHALFSSVMPSLYMDGYLRSMINFPAWLGKNSSANKHNRLMRQLEAHTFHKIFSDCHSLVTEYVPILRDALSLPLILRENEGVQDVIAVLDEYDLTREDSDEIAELGTWPNFEDYRKKVSTKVKSALTRAFNKHSHLLPYTVDEVSKKRGRVIVEPEFEIDEEGNLIEIDGSDGLNEDDKAQSDTETPVLKVNPTSSKSETNRSGRGKGKGNPRSLRGLGSKGNRGRGRGRGR